MPSHGDDKPSFFIPVWLDQRARQTRPWQGLPLGPDADRLWTQLMRARVAVASVLLLLQILLQLQGSGRSWLAALCLAYLCGTLAVLARNRPGRDVSAWSPRWLATLWTDIACFALLQALQGGAVDFAPLFLLPVLLAATLGPLALALASAAAATLVLLGNAALALWTDPAQAAPRFMQIGLTGTGFFLLALLSNQLAQRLARERALVGSSQALARLQGKVNGLISNGLSEGVLVFDAQGQVWHANPAALSMLGLAQDHGEPAMHEVARSPAGRLLLDWGRQGLARQIEGEQELEIPAGEGSSRKLHVRLRLTAPSTHDGGSVGVLFLEDLREIEARIRTERLAAMGRVSAAVAHEIRNPLAAISQANALLAEDALAPQQQGLCAMIGRNAQRLARTVDDVLDLARVNSRPRADAAVALDARVQEFVQEWLAALPASPPLQLSLGAPAARVHFESEHLRRVLVNLLDNARKHASTGAVRVWTGTDGVDGAVLTVWSEGTPIAKAVQQHLFEPFFSSDSRSSGLGLYICRELCLRYRAEIGYRRLSQSALEGNAFVVRMPVLPA